MSNWSLEAPKGQQGPLGMVVEPPSRPGLWPLAQFGRLVTLWVLAFVLLAVATVGSRGDADPENAGLWVLLGLLGGMLAGAGTTFWLIAGTRAVRAREQDITRRVVELTPALRAILGVPDEAVDSTDPRPEGDGLVRLPDGTLYHRADCLLVAGKSAIGVDVIDQTLAPCGVCAP